MHVAMIIVGVTVHNINMNILYYSNNYDENERLNFFTSDS